MARVPFPASSSPAARPQESGGRLVNGYVIEVEGSPPSPIKWLRSPGIRQSLTLSAWPGYTDTDINCRGLTTIGGTIMHIVNEACYAVTQLSETELQANRLGDLTGTTPVTFAQNNVQPVPDTWAVTNGAAFIITTGSAPAAYDGGGNLVAPNSTTNIDGYTCFSSAGGKIQATNLNSTTLPSNSFVDLPEGNLLRIIEHKNQLWAFGREFFRVYDNVGATPFPLEYAGVKVDIGIAGTHAIAGYEPGWSGAVIFAGSDNRVYRLEGYTPVPISSDPLSAAIESSDKDELVARAYVSGGHSFWSITDPGNFTWEYNLETGLWHERESYQRDDWRGRATVKAYDRWYIGDDVTGNLYTVIDGWPSDGPDPLIFILEDGCIRQTGAKINVPWTYADFTSGVGLDAGLIPTQTAPVVRVFTSLDGGALYGKGITYPLGGEGEGNTQIRIGNSGLASAKGVRRRYEISDGVHVGFMGAEAEVEVRPA